MAKKTLNESVLEKIFYYIGKGMRPVIFKKMSAKSRNFKNKYAQLQKTRKELDDILEKKFGINR